MKIDLDTVSWPTDVVAAATHADPYPFYAGLVRERPLYRDDDLGMWVASGTDAVEAVLTSPLCRVRPVGEPVPAALVGTTAGAIFGRLVRMSDGQEHVSLKRAVAAALSGVDADRATTVASAWAATLWDRSEGAEPSVRVTALMLDLSPHVVGDLLGIPREHLADVSTWMGAFVRCLTPASTTGQVAAGITAAEKLSPLVSGQLRRQIEDGSGGLLGDLQRALAEEGVDDEAVTVANGVGLLSQAYEATAGLIGNAILALAADADAYGKTVSEPTRARDMVEHVLRRDPPIQSTRRIVAADGEIAGHVVRAGDVILVLLAANHDPAPPRPGVAGRPHGFSLGAGLHACPGGTIAIAVAEAAVRRIVASGVPLGEVVSTVAYRPSANARVPVFGAGEASA